MPGEVHSLSRGGEFRKCSELLSEERGVSCEFEGLGLPNGEKGKQGGSWGNAPEQSPREGGQDPSQRTKEGPGRAAGQESPRGPNHSACVVGSPSWELEGDTAGWTGGRAARRWGLRSCGRAVNTSCDLETVCALPFLPPTYLPTPSLELQEGLALGFFTQCLAGPHRAALKCCRVKLLPGTVGILVWDSLAALDAIPRAAT